MGKSTTTSDGGLIHLLDEPDLVRRKVSRAVTDPGGRRVRPGPQAGVSNLLEILAACERDQPDVVALGLIHQLRRAEGGGQRTPLWTPCARSGNGTRSWWPTRRTWPRYGATRTERARDWAAATVYRAKQAIGLLS